MSAKEIYSKNRNLGSYSLQTVLLTTEIKLKENKCRCLWKVRISLQDVLTALRVGNFKSVWCEGRGTHTSKEADE